MLLMVLAITMANGVPDCCCDVDGCDDGGDDANDTDGDDDANAADVDEP